MTLPGSGLGTTSLGAVGGPRGTAAGALRILVEFLTQYDAKAVKQLEADLKSLGDQDAATSAKQLAAQRAFETSKKREVDTAKEIKKLVSSTADKPSAVRSRLREIQNIGVLSKEGQKRLGILSRELTGNSQLLNLVTKRARQERSINGFRTRGQRLAQQELSVQEQQAAKQTQLSAFQKLKGGLGPKLGGLALGALGGIVGGAVLGVGFAAAEAALDAIGEQLQNLFDPGRKARDIIKEVGQAVVELASSADNAGDLTKGSKEFLENLGLQADEQTVALLAQAAALSEGNKQLAARLQIIELEKGVEAERTRLIKETTRAVAEQQGIPKDFDLRDLGVEAQVAADAERDLAAAEDSAAESARKAAAASYNLERARRAQQAAAQLAAFAEENLAAAISNAAQPRITGLDSQIAGLQNAGDSARTKGLESQIQKLQDAASGGSSGNNAELANIAEEKALILLRQRLRLMGTAIDLEKYSGKFLLEAINAKLAALQKEAAAQDRLNKLLDLQFRMSQKLRRNEGETISDFLERRAQENRGFLSEQRDLEREGVEARLNELKDKTQDEVALAELAERRKNAASKGGTDNRIRDLQRELEASRENDRKITRARIQALQDQKEALEKARDDAIKFSSQEYNEKIRLAISAANTVEKLSELSGQIAGLSAAKAFISGLIASGGLSPADAARLTKALVNINNSLGQYAAKKHNIITGHAVGTGPLEYAQGGLIRLNNASTPFGSNARFGEGGDEFGLIFQNKVAQKMKDNMKQVGDMTFNMQRGDDWLRDRYEFKRFVKEAVKEALG